MSSVATKKRKTPSDDPVKPKGIQTKEKRVSSSAEPAKKATKIAKVAKPAADAGGKVAKASIDDLFGGISAAKKANKKAAVKLQKEVADEANTISQQEGSDMGFLQKNEEGRKRTDEGFLIYEEDELNMMQGGDSALCPFDCNCCF